MRIVLTGGGTGGHFYPLIAVAEELSVQWSLKTNKDRLDLYFFSVNPYDADALEKNSVRYVHIPSGKIRIYPTLKNIPSILHLFVGIVIAVVKLFFIYPDVVFGKGGYASAPTLIAARLLAIPVVTQCQGV
jgi:UDP-N-acetylglucosamine--N-acetylmuramyl-(pentapeptide) pyrophosphoryl-undecaprenol N-acetylglucosamine transferase